ncbi:MAG: GNAT family N-acetyltransferase [Patescibacteria group bacterium]|nr:GNAT family N-acetyltransferase [Patescibacteria group bacterium]
MEIKQKTIKAGGIKFFIEQDGREAARAYLYILKNDLHERPFGFMEDVFVGENFRSQGLGARLVEELIKAAKLNNCYKLIGNSRQERFNVHELYERLGFKNWGKEFRMEF